MHGMNEISGIEKQIENTETANKEIQILIPNCQKGDQSHALYSRNLVNVSHV